jgi:hypothetical protein
MSDAWRKVMIAGLLRGQRSDGSFGVTPYTKFTGAHWRLVSLVELGVPRTNAAARAAARNELGWLDDWTRPRVVINGLERRHASIEGNALAVCCRLGMANSPRVARLAEILIRSQWPDGGWNCRRDTDAHRSSFHESLAPIWGLVEYHRANHDIGALDAAKRAGELLLEHRLFRALRTGRVIHPEWVRIHWPHYWHYDYFHGLRAIAMLGLLRDPRAADALELLTSQKKSDNTWRAGGRRYWRLKGKYAREVVDWGDAHQIITPAAKALLS